MDLSVDCEHIVANENVTFLLTEQGSFSPSQSVKRNALTTPPWGTHNSNETVKSSSTSKSLSIIFSSEHHYQRYLADLIVTNTRSSYHKLWSKLETRNKEIKRSVRIF